MVYNIMYIVVLKLNEKENEFHGFRIIENAEFIKIICLFMNVPNISNVQHWKYNLINNS